jgi:hypothetical protein
MTERSWRNSFIMPGVLILVLVMGGANLLATYLYVHSFQASQKRQGLLVEEKLCKTFGNLAALKPPPGDPKTNPSRAYDQGVHTVLSGVGPDIGCPKRK